MPDCNYFARPTYTGSYRWIDFARRTPFDADFDVFRDRDEIWFQIWPYPRRGQDKAAGRPDGAATNAGTKAAVGHSRPHGRVAGHRPDFRCDRRLPFLDMKDADPMTPIVTDPNNTARLAQDSTPDNMTRVIRARRRAEDAP